MEQLENKEQDSLTTDLPKEEVKQMSATQLASVSFDTLLPKYKNLINSLSGKSLKRLLVKLVEEPTGMKYKTGANTSEATAFDIAQYLIKVRLNAELEVMYEIQEQAKVKIEGEKSNGEI